ncbi:MAG: SulP family inorganic anion transporter [Hyphomicrobiaceae bacterium]|nr:SulP family inorganic anion transporter [Hyphomicrobiaceae bacterium]
MQNQQHGGVLPPPSTAAGAKIASYWSHFVPKLVIAVREGYGIGRLSSDLIAGLTVAILALPLSMAIAIGAGATPDRGLVTSVVAGFCISAFGGSRFQVGGPAAAFIVIIANIIGAHGLAGLMTATFLAGFVLVAAAMLRLGTYIKYIPGPVILGFTSGIGIIIAVGQLKDFLGLNGDVPPEFLHKIAGLWEIKGTFNPSALLVGGVTLAVISLMRRWRPSWPGLLFAVVAASGVAWAFGLPVDTIGSRFGGIPNALPVPQLPDLSPSMIAAVLPSAFTIAFLVGVESLLSAVAADAKTGGRHRSNAEVLGQGIANIASPLFGGLPATGVIARTGTNISAGAKTPLSGVFHAVFVLLFMLLAAPAASYLALPCLAAVLLNVSWRLIDYHEVSHFLTRAPFDDRLVLIATLVLTVVVDLNVAIGVGFGLACMLFMHRMSEASIAGVGEGRLDDRDLDDVSTPRSVLTEMPLPVGIRVLSLRGPLFFGGASTVVDTLRNSPAYPKVLILRMRDVPLVDATALSALEDLATDLAKHDSRLVISGLQKQPREAMHRMGLLKRHRVIVASNGFIALEKAKGLLAGLGSRS